MIKENVSIPSVKLVESNRRDAVGRLLAYTRNRSGPRIDLWETPQVTYLRSVLLFSLIWMYCFLVDK